MEDMLKPISLMREVEDKWCWKHSIMQVFLIKTAYSFLTSSSDDSQLADTERRITKKYWLRVAPSKFLVHGWSLLLDRLPMRKLLQQRSVMDFLPSPCYVFCFRHDEESQHLFFTCGVSDQLWKGIFDWLGVQPRHYSDGWDHLAQHGIVSEGKK